MRKKEIKLKNCLECGSLMERKTSGAGRIAASTYLRKKYCNRICKGAAHSKNLKGNSNPNYKGGKTKCIDCEIILHFRYAENKKRCKSCWYKFNSGKNHIFYKGVLSTSDLIRGMAESAKWRKSVFERDNYTCVQCGDSRGGNLNADHIKPFALIIKQLNITSRDTALNCKELWDIENGRTLCVTCHKMTNTYGFGTIKLIRETNIC